MSACVCLCGFFALPHVFTLCNAIAIWFFRANLKFCIRVYMYVYLIYFHAHFSAPSSISPLLIAYSCVFCIWKNKNKKKTKFWINNRQRCICMSQFANLGLFDFCAVHRRALTLYFASALARRWCSFFCVSSMLQPAKPVEQQLLIGASNAGNAIVVYDWWLLMLLIQLLRKKVCLWNANCCINIFFEFYNFQIIFLIILVMFSFNKTFIFCQIY